MVLGMVEVLIFLMVIGFGCLYLSYKREAIAWCVIATVVFASNVVYGASIPFKTADGAVLPTPANYILSGINLLFAFIALIRSVWMAFNFLAGTKT